MSVETFYGALGVELAGAGRKAVVRCFANPDAHRREDRDASAEVYRDKGTWHCYGCGEWGGPYKAALARGLSEREAMALVSEHDLDVKEQDEPLPQSPAPNLRATESEARRYHKVLASNAAALDRLEELRGWTSDAIARHGLGLDEEGRVTFPIVDEAHMLVGLLRYAPNGELRRGPKLLADSGSRRELFPAPEHVESDCLFLVEGEPDAVSAESLGVPAVAVPGVSTWRENWAERFAGRRVVVCMDSDGHGRRAAQERAQALAAHAAEVRIIDLAPDRDDGYDLGDWCLEASRNGGHASGRHALEQVVKSAEPLQRPSAGQSLRHHPESIDLAGLLASLSGFIRRYVVMSEAQAAVVALWVLHTHATGAADSTPYLAITSAEKRSGKTRLLELLAELVARPLATSNISEAALFRSIAQDAPTLLFDEIDAVFGAKARDREDLRGMVNAGHRRGAMVRRVGGANRDKLEAFPVFCPKALAGIGELPDTVADRAVSIRLERRAPDERIARGRLRQIKAEAAPLRERAERWAEETHEHLRLAEPELPEALDDRAQDGAEPLLAIADLAGGEWAERSREALVELHGRQDPEEDSIGVRLLADIRAAFQGSDRITTADLLEALRIDEEAPWRDWRGSPLSARGLAGLLRRYGIKSRSIRLDSGETPKGFLREQFESVWKRYLPTDVASIRHSATTRMGTGETPNLKAPQDSRVADSREDANRHHDWNVAGVADTGRGEAP